MATAIVLGALALTLAFTLAGMSFSHLTVSNRLSNIGHARSLAEATLAQAVERVVSNEGEYFETAPLDLPIHMNHPPAGHGRLTFDLARASDWEIPISTNNLKSENSTTGYDGRVIPQKSIHFVAVGEYAGVTKRMECILHIPTYKYALSSQGPISSSGAMIVASAENPGDVLPSAAAKLDDLLPGHILSNSPDSNYALDLYGGSGQITVTGDARAVGGIHPTGASLEIQGSARPNSEPADMPVIELNDFDPASFGGTQDFASPPAAVETANGLFKHNGDLVLGELRLPNNNTGAIVWVTGDLTINNGVSGVGAIFATGNITIRGAGQPSVSADNVMAVVAGKGLDIQGSGVDSAFFQGVVASGDSANLEEVTVLGAVVVGATEVGGVKQGSAEPTLTLTNANLVNIPDNVGFDFEYPFGMGAGGAGGADFGFWAQQKSGGPDPNSDPILKVDIQEKKGWGGQDEFDLAHLYNPATDRFESGPWSQWDGFAPYNYDAGTHTFTGSPWGYYRASEDKYLNPAELDAMFDHMEANYDLYGPKGGPYTDWAAFYAGEDLKSRAEVIQNIVDVTLHRGTNSFENQLQQANDDYDNKFKDQSKETGTFTMDPNQYVNWDSRTRILVWRDF